MPQDAYTLRYLCEELNDIFKGGKINRIVQPSNDQTIFTVYTGKTTKKLFLDVNPAAPRIGVIAEELESPITAPNFCMLLRKHLLSATITGVSLVGFDRIVRIDITPSTEFFDALPKSLYIELMGRYSNIILTEKGKILGGNRGINMLDNGVRPLIVGKPYEFPPVGDKKLPSDEGLIELLDKGGEISQIITANIQGVAKSTAIEIEKSYYEKCAKIDGKRLFEHITDFLYKKDYSPCVITENGEVKDVCVFPYTQISGEVISFNGLLEAEEFYYSERDKKKSFTALKDRLSGCINGAVKKANKRLTAISAREKEAFGAEENKIKGELILANIYRIKAGDASVIADNYYDGTKLEISLDVNLTPAENAERYYKKYNKQKRALAALAPQKEGGQKELDYLLSVADFIALADNIEDLACIKEELIAYGLLKDRHPLRKKAKEEKLGRVYLINGFTVRAGRNNVENDKIAFSAKAEDIWLHAKDYHSSHVVIECAGREVFEDTLVKAAEICAYYSKGREGGKTEIVYTKRKNLKKPPKSKAGFCTYTDFKSITVEPKSGAEFLKTT